jgi:hypothetical protein
MTMDETNRELLVNADRAFANFITGLSEDRKPLARELRAMLLDLAESYDRMTDLTVDLHHIPVTIAVLRMCDTVQRVNEDGKRIMDALLEGNDGSG